MSEPIEIQAGKTYVVELDTRPTIEQYKTMSETWFRETGSNAIFLYGMKVARVASEAEEAIARVRELHKNNNGVCAVCIDDYNFMDSHLEWLEYPCPTIKALDGDE